jgi:aryl-alcohol dehydrogenase-like predicted oxidoreductase
VKVTVITGKYKSGTKYWLVRYPLPDGTPDRKFFADKQSAENYAETKRRESPDAAMIQRALELGVNTFDTAHGYGGGESERRLGQALRGARQPVFVSTKIIDRTRDGARWQMDTSLQRLGMDRVDLMFVHGLDDEEDYRKVVGPNSVLRAIEEFRSAGRIRLVGVSGHWYRQNMERILAE